MSATTDRIEWKTYGYDQFARLHGLELFVQPAVEPGVFYAYVDDGNDVQIFKETCESREAARTAAEQFAESYLAGQAAKARADLASDNAVHARAVELFLAYYEHSTEPLDSPAANETVAAFTDFVYGCGVDPGQVYSHVLGTVGARLCQAERRITDLVDAGNRADDRASMLTKLLAEIDGDLEVLESHTGGIGTYAQELRRKITRQCVEYTLPTYTERAR